MGDLGYHNNAQSSLNICFNELETYTKTLYRAIHTPWPPYEAIGTRDGDRFIQINTSILQIENEYYSAVRPKRTTRREEKPIQALEARGVEYIEVRCMDLDPFLPVGIDGPGARFLDAFLLYCLLEDSPQISDCECAHLDDNFRKTVARGRELGLLLEWQGQSSDVCSSDLYIEVRCLDLDPFSPVGMNEQQIDFLDLFLLDCLLSDSPRIGDDECERLDDNYKDVVSRGRSPELTLCDGRGPTTVGESALRLLDRLQGLAGQLDGLAGGDTYRNALTAQRAKVENPELLPSAQVLQAMKTSGLGHRDWGMEMARQHRETLLAEPLEGTALAEFERMSADSLAEQVEMERSDSLSFEDFLAQYLRN